MFYVLLYLLSVCLFGYFFCRIMEDIGEDTSFFIMLIGAIFWPVIIFEAFYGIYKKNKLDADREEKEDK